MASDTALRSWLKVEQKFVPNSLLQAQLDGKYDEYERLRRMQGGTDTAPKSSALVLFRRADKTIKDVYVDFEDRLSKQGIWIRKRTSKAIKTESFPFVDEDNAETVTEWQAKLRLGGDIISSQMMETTGVNNMKYVCSLYLSGVPLSKVVPMAKLQTERMTFIVQRPFGWNHHPNHEHEIRVVLDKATASAPGDDAKDPFEHTGGKVEMTAEVVGGESAKEHDLLRQQELARMKARLEEFVARNAASFPNEGVKGKLKAFFEWKDACDGSTALM